MNITIDPSQVFGSIIAPSSKSATHRATICASLAKGTSKIANALICDDTLATMGACEALGMTISEKDGILEITAPETFEAPANTIDCGGSGSTLRFFTPICALAPGTTTLTGNDSLLNRPMSELLKALDQLGVKTESQNKDGKPPITVTGGGIGGGYAAIAGNISSQYISGLLLFDTVLHIALRSLIDLNIY